MAGTHLPEDFAMPLAQPSAPAITRRGLLASLAALGLPGGGARAQGAQKPASPLHYYSDYFSFVGRDGKGHVYLAHDSNRGRSGNDYQADHWIAMYDEATGWIDVKGSQHYPNPGKVLERIPASEHFRFEGSPQAGTVMVSDSNGMRMTVGPLPATLRRENADGIFWVGGAPATLEWNGRRLEGRVVFEYLQRHNWNRFVGGFERNWRNFNGLYLMTDSGHDFYAHYHEREGGSDLTGRLVGLASWDVPAPVGDLKFTVRETAAIPYRGYRWPVAWTVGFTHAGARHTLDLVTAERRVVADWETGGFAMSVVSGSIMAAGGRRMKVAGWAELLI
jgi:hypothetical protein